MRLITSLIVLLLGFWALVSCGNARLEAARAACSSGDSEACEEVAKVEREVAVRMERGKEESAVAPEQTKMQRAQLLAVQAQSAVRSRLRDPSSAQFGEICFVETDDSWAVCGSVNAKNGFGGYVGEAGFIAAGSQAFIETDLAEDEWRKVWSSLCTKAPALRVR